MYHIGDIVDLIGIGEEGYKLAKIYGRCEIIAITEEGIKLRSHNGVEFQVKQGCLEVHKILHHKHKVKK